jgi:hypothetical protein
MYNAAKKLAASSARTRQQRCSQVSNNEASVFHRQTLIRAKMISPHQIVVDPGVDSRQRSLRGRFLPSPRWTSAVDLPWHVHDTHAAGTTYSTHGGGYVHSYSATRRAAPPAANWASRDALSSKAAEPPAFASWSSLGNIAHAARFGRNETLIAGLKLEAPARNAVVQLRLDAMPLVVTLAVGAIGRQHVAAQGLFACCEKSSAYVKRYSLDGGILIYPSSSCCLGRKHCFLSFTS